MIRVKTFAFSLALVAANLPASSWGETFYYTGPFGGEFFTEANWSSAPDGSGVAPAAGSIEPDIGFTHDLIIDGDTVVASGDDGFVLDVGDGGALSLLSGSDLQVNNLFFNGEFELSTGATFNLVDAFFGVDDDIVLRGVSSFTNGEVQSFADDIEFRGGPVTIVGTEFNIDDSIILETDLTSTSGSSITGAAFSTGGRIGIRGFDVVVSDTSFSATGDLENVFTTDLDDATGTLTLLGSSSISADQIQEGVKLRLRDSSTATLTNVVEFIQEPTWMSQSSTVILDSPDAQLTLENTQSNVFDADFDHDVDVDGVDFLIWQRGFGKTDQTDNSMGDADGNGTVDVEDLRDWRARYQTTNARLKVVNGTTGLSYALDPNSWNITTWNGIDPVTLSIVGPSSTASNLTSVPELSTMVLVGFSVGMLLTCRPRAEGLLYPWKLK